MLREACMKMAGHGTSHYYICREPVLLLWAHAGCWLGKWSIHPENDARRWIVLCDGVRDVEKFIVPVIHSRVIIHLSSLTCYHSPIITHVSSLTCHHSPVITHVSSFTCHHSCVIIHVFSFTSPVIIHVLSFTCHHSCVIIHVLSSTCHHSRVIHSCVICSCVIHSCVIHLWLVLINGSFILLC